MRAIGKPYKSVMREVQRGFIGSQMIGNTPEAESKAKERITYKLSVNVNMCNLITLPKTK